MEKLYAEFLLWINELYTNEKYESLLHDYFLNAPNDNVLLELEECTSDLLKTNAIFHNLWVTEDKFFDVDVFGEHLFAELESIYVINKFSIEEFGKRCNSLWGLLPFHISQEEPFWTLNYADDCLTWNDEAQTRKLYEKAFSFYRKKE